MFLCIGDIDIDVLIAVDRLPTRDGKVNGRLLQRVPGGMAGNVAVGLSRLEAQVRILGRVGDDEEAAFALEGLAQAGIDTGFVTRMPGLRTFSCIGLITPDGEKSLIKLMTPTYRPDANDVGDAAFRDVTHVHLTSVGDPALCHRAVAAARRAGATVSLDVEHADCPLDPGELASSIQGFDLLFCNAKAREVIDARLSTPLLALVPEVVTTLGAAGARVEADGGLIEAAGFWVDAKDTTGAGDCFAAACLHARLVQRLAWHEALRFANCAAALSTTSHGAQTALPRLGQVAAALARPFKVG